ANEPRAAMIQHNSSNLRSLQFFHSPLLWRVRFPENAVTRTEMICELLRRLLRNILRPDNPYILGRGRCFYNCHRNQISSSTEFLVLFAAGGSWKGTVQHWPQTSPKGTLGTQVASQESCRRCAFCS